MSIENVISAIEYIDERGLERKYLQDENAVNIEQVEEVEGQLEFVFPDSYRFFLLNYGFGDFEGLEFYGLVDGNNNYEGIENAFWYTKELRRDAFFPVDLFVIESLGDGTEACLNLTMMENNECPVVLFDTGCPDDIYILAESYGVYFYNRVQEAIKSL